MRKLGIGREIAKSLSKLEDDAESGMFERTVVISTSESDLRQREAWRERNGRPRGGDILKEGAERRQRPAARRRKLDNWDHSKKTEAPNLEEAADAVIAAVKAGNRDEVHLILSSHKSAADILANAKNVSDHGENALMLASEKGDLALVQLLLKFGALPSARDYEGRSALHFAIANHHQEVAEAILLAQAARSE